MDHINELKNIRNSLKLLNNSKSIEYIDLEKLFNQYSAQKIEIENEIFDINEELLNNLKTQIISICGIVLSVSPIIGNEYDHLFLIAFILILICNKVKYIKQHNKYLQIKERNNDIEDKLQEIVMNTHSIKKKMEKLDDRINYLNSVIEQNDMSKVDEILKNKEKYLSLEM